MPRGTAKPYAVLSGIERHSERLATGPDTEAEALFQLDIWADLDSEAETLAEAVRKTVPTGYSSALDGFRGTMGSTAVSSAVIEAIRDLSELETGDIGVQRFRRSLDIRVRYVQAV